MPVCLDVIGRGFFQYTICAHNIGIDEFMVFSTIINISFLESKSPFPKDK